MNCGNYVNYAMLSNNFKTLWLQHYQNAHEDQQIPVFLVEGINDVCQRIACIVNGDPTNYHAWNELNNLTNTIAQSILMYEKYKEETEKEESTLNNNEE